MSTDSSTGPSPDPGAPRRWLNAAVVGQEVSRETWALAAREKLEQTALTYGSVVTTTDLAQWVQERSLIRTKQLARHWIGDVLSRVALSCVERREPLLSALCVDSSGHVSPGYALAVEMHRGGPAADADAHAAQERLECHRWFGAPLPPGGGEPVVTVRAAGSRADRMPRVPGARPAGRRAGAGHATSPRTPRAGKTGPVVPPEKPLVVCPVHFTVLPVTGVCDDCD